MASSARVTWAHLGSRLRVTPAASRSLSRYAARVTRSRHAAIVALSPVSRVLSPDFDVSDSRRDWILCFFE